MRKNILLTLVATSFATFFVMIASWAVYVLLGQWPKLSDMIGIGLLLTIFISFSQHWEG